jgi:hypothetical protein
MIEWLDEGVVTGTVAFFVQPFWGSEDRFVPSMRISTSSSTQF